LIVDAARFFAVAGACAYMFLQFPNFAPVSGSMASPRRPSSGTSFSRAPERCAICRSFITDHSRWPGWIAYGVSLAGALHAALNRAGVAVLCLLPWLVLIDYWPPPLERPLVRNPNSYVWPPAETPVSKFLARETALRPGQPFRGRIASIAGSDFEPEWTSGPLIAQHNYDVLNLFLSGNDHRLYGLWYYGIPTLLELNQFSSPFFHLVNARLLNAPGTKDRRSY
jgi:hypothetical protein